MANLTDEQRAAVECGGNSIVSASAGSGKTFVMIEKLTRAIENGADLDNVLAVTFTKKAAAQMKERLRTALISKVEGATGQTRARLKAQIAKIPSADISTIHSFCARLIRTYFYVLDVDGGFDIISDDDPAANDLKERALENLFDKKYESGDGEFLHLLKRFSKKNSDASFKKLILESHKTIRSIARYGEKLSQDIYTPEGFKEAVGLLNAHIRRSLKEIEGEIEKFEPTFKVTSHQKEYGNIFAEMLSAVRQYYAAGCFSPQIPLTLTQKPRDPAADKEQGERFKLFKKQVQDAYTALFFGFSDEETEYKKYLESGVTAKAFSRLLLEFDGEYSRLKGAENKLDYNDLEHLTLLLFQNGEVREEVGKNYSLVFVDEYQDVNPVQEEIISSLCGQTFLVGDIKQAIYGFRGSKSSFFSQKFEDMQKKGGNALRLLSNFRSAPNVLNFVNSVFSQAMSPNVCGFDFSDGHGMVASGPYPPQSGKVMIHRYSDEEEEGRIMPVYSVKEDARKASHTAEGLAVLKIVEEELQSELYDPSLGAFRKVQTGDICILTRKNKNESTEGIIRALKDEGYPVYGGQEGNICDLAEVKQIIDILCFLDNARQDVPMVSSMLSPLGGFSEDELAQIRVRVKAQKPPSFYDCCLLYGQNYSDVLAQKLNTFHKKAENLRDLSEILSAGELVEKIIADTGLCATLSQNGGAKLKNVLKFASEGSELTLPAFLAKLKAGGYFVSAPASAPSNSIKVMSMHAAKGLEFPVVILSDINRTFRGNESYELLFDDCFGFAPKVYDFENMVSSPTVLRRLIKVRADGENLKNELNLFYVACTRAQYSLHILTGGVPAYSPLSAAAATCYAQTFDLSRFPISDVSFGEIQSPVNVEAPAEPDPALLNNVRAVFGRPYAFAQSVDLPVKSSASAILRAQEAEEPYFMERELFPADGSTAERGTAYHRFLELCDFSKKSAEEISAQIDEFVKGGLMDGASAELLKVEELQKIVNMPVFGGLSGFELMREQEFLCRIEASEILNTPAKDFVLVQGAIDLLARRQNEVKIIDYKYSQKEDGELIKTYKKQLDLYKKAVSAVLGVKRENISATIINIRLLRQINLDI